MPEQMLLTWDTVKGTGMEAGAFADFFALSIRHFATQSRSVIPAAWLNALLAPHSFSQVAKAFLWAKDDVGNASPRQIMEHTISIDALIMSETRFMPHLLSLTSRQLHDFRDATA
jgi:hypothetical protein